MRRLEKSGEVAEKHSIIWGQAAPKLKTSFPWIGRKRALYYVGFLHRLTWGFPSPVSKVEGTTVGHRVPCLLKPNNLPFLFVPSAL